MTRHLDRALALPSVAAERDGTGALIRRALYGASRIALLGPSSVPTYEHTDALGSVTDLASGAGSSLAWSEYAPYGAVRSAGAVTGAPADPFGFTGAYTDAPTGLLHLRARQYDPGIGRFLSVDPAVGPIGRPCVSAYVYGRDNPLRYVDPSGLESQAAGNEPGGWQCLAGVLTMGGLAVAGGETALGGGEALELGGAVATFTGLGLVVIGFIGIGAGVIVAIKTCS